MNVDGSEPRALTEEQEHLVHNPYWSPDGEYIAVKKGFTSTRSIPGGEIWLIHGGGGGGLQLVERPLGDKDQKTMAEPSFSPDGRYIYHSQDTTPGARWQYNKDSTRQIFVVKRLDREKGETDVFVSGPGGAIRPTPSPDGKYLAFVRRTPAMTSALYVKHLETGLELPVYSGLDRDLQETNGSQGNTTAFSWTPDGTSIVFWSGGKIRRVDVESHETAEIPVHLSVEKKIQPALRFPIAVAPEELEVKMLRWSQISPDGSRVVFQAPGHLYVADADGGNRRRLTAQTEHFEFYPSFSPDGRQIACTTWSDEGLGSVRVVAADGGAARSLTSRPGHYLAPRFSPDGKQIVYRKIAGGFLLSASGSMEPGIYVAPVSGGEPRRASKSGYDAHFGAANDRVFFSTDKDDTKLLLHSVDLHGHEKRTHLEGDKVTGFRLSPDGRWVAFTEQYNAYVAPFTFTGKTVKIGSKVEPRRARALLLREGRRRYDSSDDAGVVRGPREAPRLGTLVGGILSRVRPFSDFSGPDRRCGRISA